MNGKLPLLALLGASMAVSPRLSAAAAAANADDAAAKSPATAPAYINNKGSAKLLAELSAKFGVPEQELIALREQKMGWGEIGLALAISQKAGVPLATVVQLRQSGMGWGQIAQKYGFKLGAVARQGRRIASAGRRAEFPGGDRDSRGMAARRMGGAARPAPRFSGRGGPR